MELRNVNSNIKNNSFIEEIIDKINEKRLGIFDEVYTVYLQILLSQIYVEFISLKKSKINIDIESILKSVGICFKDELIQLCNKTLIGELYVCKSKNKLVGKTPEERYEYFMRQLLEHKKYKIFSDESILTSLIEKRINNKTKIVIEFIERFLKDISSIESEFNINITDLKDIKLSAGDTHNSGHAVIIVYLNDDRKIIYKPHTLKNDETYKNIITMVNEEFNLKAKLKYVPFIDCGGYGWQKFIGAFSCSNEEEVKRYMYRTGAILSLLHILKTNDIHRENIIACGDQPMLIDLETLVQNTTSHKIKSYMNDKFNKMILDSVYNTLMLPENFGKRTLMCDLSGVAGGNKYTTNYVQANKIINEGTDNIQYDIDDVKLEETFNRVKLNNEDVDITYYLNEMMQGFEDTYKSALTNRKLLINFLENSNNFKGELRQVLRPTFVYGKFLDASYHPYYLENKSMRDKVFNQLFSKNFLTEEEKLQIKIEVSQLKNDDIPYFYCKYDSTDLYTDNNVIKDFYENNVKSILINRVNNLSIDDLEKQLYFIKGSISSIVKEKEGKTLYNKYPNKIFNNMTLKGNLKDDCIFLAKYIGDYVDSKYSIILQDGYHSFFTINENENGDLNLGVLNSYLYEGAGVLLFYLYLYKETGEQKYKDIVIKNLTTLNLSLDLFLENVGGGVFNGVASLLYLNYNAYTILKEEQIKNSYEKILDVLIESELPEDDELDIIGGAAGIIVMALDIYKNNNEDKFLYLAKKYGKFLYYAAKDKNLNIPTGFAHGYAGISTALMLLAYYLKENNYYDLAMEIINKEDKLLYNEENKHCSDIKYQKYSDLDYWCHGLSGIALARTMILPYLKDKDKPVAKGNVDILCKKLINNAIDTNDNNSLCHGNMGNIDILFFIANKIGERSIKVLAENKAAELISSMVSCGVKLPYALNVESINFMTGLTGIGYSLLRIQNNNLPSILTLSSIS